MKICMAEFCADKGRNQLILKLTEGSPAYLGLIHKAEGEGFGEEEITGALKKGLQKRAEFWDRKAGYEFKTSGYSALYRILVKRAGKNRNLLSILEQEKLGKYKKAIIFHSKYQ